MILYQLQCVDEHTFEGWFRDSVSFDAQASSGDIECPYCASKRIIKAPMAPRLGSNTKGENLTPEARAMEVARQILDAAVDVRRYVEENFDDVGEDFADEARRIHYGDANERGIYGNTNDEEAEALEEEGVDFVRLPETPRKDS